MYSRPPAGCALLLAALLFPLLTLAQPRQQSGLTITGIDGELRTNVLAFLSLPGEPCDAPEARLRRRLARADNEARTALRALGYYRPQIESSLEFAADCWSAMLNIAAGEPVRVRVSIIDLIGEAKEDPAFISLIRTQPPHDGDIARHDSYEQLKQSLADLAADRGYLDARFIGSELNVDPAADAADILIRFESGARYRIDKVHIDQDFFDPDFVAQFNSIEEGEFYTSDRIFRLQRNFSDSGYFSNVNVVPRMSERHDNRVSLDVTLTPLKRYNYSAGLGAATDIGPRLRLGYEDRRFNNRGHRLGAQLALSEVQSELTGNYRLPFGDDPLFEWLEFNTGYRSEDTDTTDSETVLAALRRGVKRGRGWQETRSLEFSRENFRLAGQDTSTTLFIPGLEWAKTRASSRSYVRRGYRVNLKLRGSLENLFSELSFGQIILGSKGILSMPFDARLLGRIDVGASTVDGFAELPTSLRFFAGGDSSVRGYDFKTLGPTNANGEVIGGRELLVGSLEYEQPVYKNWGVAVFVDSGNALEKLSSTDLETGAGIGVRWHSPIGPIRLDVANAVSVGQGWRLHLSMGPDL